MRTNGCWSERHHFDCRSCASAAELDTIMLGDDCSSPLRPELLRIVREHVQTGVYQPPVDDVAEQLVAWFFADELRQAV